MMKYRVDFDSLSWDSPVKGARFKVHKHGEKQLRLVEFSKEFAEPDWCGRGHIGYVLEGRADLDFNGKVETLHAGDGVFIPAGEQHKHKLKVLTDVVKFILVENSEPTA